MKVQAIIKKGKEIYRDRNARTRYILHFSLAANIAFTLLELAEGLYFGSMWLVAIGVYYAVLGVMRFSLLRSIRSTDAREEKKAYFAEELIKEVKLDTSLKPFKENGYAFRFVYRSADDPSFILYDKTVTKEEY